MLLGGWCGGGLGGGGHLFGCSWLGDYCGGLGCFLDIFFERFLFVWGWWVCGMRLLRFDVVGVGFLTVFLGVVFCVVFCGGVFWLLVDFFGFVWLGGGLGGCVGEGGMGRM